MGLGRRRSVGVYHSCQTYIIFQGERIQSVGMYTNVTVSSQLIKYNLLYAWHWVKRRGQHYKQVQDSWGHLVYRGK